MDEDVLMLDHHVGMLYGAYLAYCKNQRKHHMQKMKLFKGKGDEELNKEKFGRQPPPPPLPEKEEDGEDEEDDDNDYLILFGFLS